MCWGRGQPAEQIVGTQLWCLVCEIRTPCLAKLGYRARTLFMEFRCIGGVSRKRGWPREKCCYKPYTQGWSRTEVKLMPELLTHLPCTFHPPLARNGIGPSAHGCGSVQRRLMVQVRQTEGHVDVIWKFLFIWRKWQIGHIFIEYLPYATHCLRGWH